MVRYFFIGIVLCLLAIPSISQDVNIPVWQTGEMIRTNLFDIQRLLFTISRADDPDAVYAEATGFTRNSNR